MSNVLIVAEQAQGALKKATFHALGAGREVARRTGGKLVAAVLGAGVGGAAEELAAHGVEVRVADAPGLEHYLAESYAPVVAQLAKDVGATYVGAGATAFGKDLLPRVAARLEAAMATEVLGFAGDGGAVTFRRPMWAGNVLAEVELATPVKVFTVRTTEFQPAPREGQGSVVPVAASVDPAALRTRFVSFKEVKSERPELTDARIVVSGGRGTKGDFKEVEALADELGAAVGASRAAVDAGWVPNDWQVGQTGKVVAPELYVAAGISGAIQHLAGMKGSKVIVAVNKDPEAPIFALADYGLVADLFKALPELRAKIKAGK
ncbi:electron transfer flavoprotein subunit alpha/FixB family protein [Anaeromyxobacter paludicola]|uniref:Electron transfer flavoprotein subunit alpha n=1 Tax=Anaeromyxobacter paludicola TaxID=2918171 RepID=A0ABM7XD02_9BACT|nr:electron transfer flavoprotein subunit alpha/FixB family protein [Anaeromyxobacter paludicola]BDG09743.1 electron transfer flavoprotein subunit alpha [Anaeromyxobacter paludicola]